MPEPISLHRKHERTHVQLGDRYIGVVVRRLVTARPQQRTPYRHVYEARSTLGRYVSTSDTRTAAVDALVRLDNESGGHDGNAG